MFCATCGTQLSADAKFCNICGSSTSSTAAGVTKIIVEPPGPASPAPASETLAGPMPVTRRLRPLVALLAGTAVLALAAAVGMAVVLLSRGSSTPTLASSSAPTLNAANSAAANLSQRLQSAASSSRLSLVHAAASVLVMQTAQAEGALAALTIRTPERRAADLLRAALMQTSIYASRVEDASTTLTPASAGAAKDAADAAQSAFGAFAAADPSAASLPAGDFDSVDQLVTLAGATQQKKQAQQQSLSSARNYVGSIDRLLTNSAEARGNLGALISNAQSGQITPVEAQAQVAAIVNQRQDLQNAIATASPPQGFQHAADLLRESIHQALNDDLAIQGWIGAWYSNDSATFNSFYAQHQQANTAATQAKQAFVAAYNTAREQVLHLGPLAIGSNY